MEQSEVSDLHVRITGQDSRINDHATRIALLEKSTETVSDGLKSINNGIWKLIWIVAGGFVTGIVVFIINGGLVVGG